MHRPTTELQTHRTTECNIQVTGFNRTKKICSKMDGVLDKNQFGFRKGRSTSQPLFILRRTQEVQEEAALESHLLLDWEKAFDKVPQSKMIRAIRRLGIPEKIINVIKAIYLAPNYIITEKEVTTTPRI